MLFINCVVHMDTKGKKAFNICMDFRGSGVSYFYFFCFLIAQIHHVASNLVFLPMLHEVNDTFHDAGHRRDSNMIMTIHGHPVHVGKRLRLFISGMHFYFLRKSYGSDSRLFFFFFFFFTLCKTVSFINPFFSSLLLLLIPPRTRIPGLFSAVYGMGGIWELLYVHKSGLY